MRFSRFRFFKFSLIDRRCGAGGSVSARLAYLASALISPRSQHLIEFSPLLAALHRAATGPPSLRTSSHDFRPVLGVNSVIISLPPPPPALPSQPESHHQDGGQRPSFQQCRREMPTPPKTPPKPRSSQRYTMTLPAGTWHGVSEGAGTVRSSLPARLHFKWRPRGWHSVPHTASQLSRGDRSAASSWRPEEGDLSAAGSWPRLAAVWGTHGAGNIHGWLLLLLRGPVVELGGRDTDSMRSQRWTDG